MPDYHKAAESASHVTHSCYEMSKKFHKNPQLRPLILKPLRCFCKLDINILMSNLLPPSLSLSFFSSFLPSFHKIRVNFSNISNSILSALELHIYSEQQTCLILLHVFLPHNNPVNWVGLREWNWPKFTQPAFMPREALQLTKT